MRKKRCRKRFTRKRSFLLFEILISLALVSLCLIPLIKPHAAIRKSQVEHLIRIQLERVSQTAFCELKQLLYENKGPSWDELNKTVSGNLEKDFQIFNAKNVSIPFICSYTMTCLASSTKTSIPKKGIVVSVELFFRPAHLEKKAECFSHTLYLEART